MWLHAKLGYLSVVLARRGPDDPEPDTENLNIRARRREHLEALQRACPSLAAIPIQESSPGRDYRFRMVPVAKALFADAIRDLILAVDYVNFKSACKQAQGLDSEFQHMLHDVWTATRRLQS